uniref:Uncharacterized protein n=1 Tax=Sphaerodactylus townsendi TaxID=933632 RepID=A0ACB8EFJ4_9SAUR
MGGLFWRSKKSHDLPQHWSYPLTEKLHNGKRLPVTRPPPSQRVYPCSGVKGLKGARSPFLERQEVGGLCFSHVDRRRPQVGSGCRTLRAPLELRGRRPPPLTVGSCLAPLSPGNGVRLWPHHLAPCRGAPPEPRNGSTGVSAILVLLHCLKRAAYSLLPGLSSTAGKKQEDIKEQAEVWRPSKTYLCVSQRSFCLQSIPGKEVCIQKSWKRSAKIRPLLVFSGRAFANLCLCDSSHSFAASQFCSMIGRVDGSSPYVLKVVPEQLYHQSFTSSSHGDDFTT